MNHEQFETVKKIIDLTPGTGLALTLHLNPQGFNGIDENPIKR